MQVEIKPLLAAEAQPIDMAKVCALVDSLSFDTHYVKGTTTVVATSVLPSGFVVATESFAGNPNEVFNLVNVIEVAISKCRIASKDFLMRNQLFEHKQALHEQRSAIAADSVRTIRANLEQARGESALHRAADLRAECTGAVQPCPCGA